MHRTTNLDYHNSLLKTESTLKKQKHEYYIIKIFREDKIVSEEKETILLTKLGRIVLNVKESDILMIQMNIKH